MPRISLYRPEKGNDYKFIDRTINEMFQVGGTDVYLHKYLGPKNPLEGEATADVPEYDVIKETNIQDLLLLENRDRKYDTSVYSLRGVYNVQDLDFNLSQFGLFIDNDTLFMTVHINNFIQTVGRKPLSGDVIELPHLKDEFALNTADYALPRFFVISDVGRAAEGFSATWYPHLYRLKLNKIADSQQYADILNVPTDKDANFVGDYDPSTIYKVNDIIRYQGVLYTVTSMPPVGTEPPNASYYSVYSAGTVQGILSTQQKSLEINDAILAQAEANAPLSGYETRQFYNYQLDDQNRPELKTIDESELNASGTSLDASRMYERPERPGYTGWLVGDGIAPNGVEFGHGIAFPTNAIKGDYWLRTDFLPNRLFRYDGRRWIKFEDKVRMNMTNNDTRQTQKTGFINNTTTNTIGTESVAERQPLSKALKPKADL